MNEELQREIEEAFAGVTREGGVSWKETDVLDGNGDMEQRLEARRQDTDKSWKEAAVDPPWLKSWGSFSFFDPIGFRYYLAAAMYRTLTHPEDTHELMLDFHLLLPDDRMKDFKLSQWSLLNDRHRRCVAHFVRHMASLDDFGSWHMAYDSYWGEIEAA